MDSIESTKSGQKSDQNKRKSNTKKPVSESENPRKRRRQRNRRPVVNWPIGNKSLCGMGIDVGMVIMTLPAGCAMLWTAAHWLGISLVPLFCASIRCRMAQFQWRRCDSQASASPPTEDAAFPGEKWGDRLAWSTVSIYIYIYSLASRCRKVPQFLSSQVSEFSRH